MMKADEDKERREGKRSRNKDEERAEKTSADGKCTLKNHEERK